MAPLQRRSEGVLSVTIYEGKDLKDKDTLGNNDPFIEIWVDEDYKQRTSEARNTNNPVWNETFAFSLNENHKAHKLHLKVLDRDIVGADKIGEASVDFKHVLQGKSIDDWVKLPSTLGLGSHGKIRLRMEFTPF
ncbi:C2 domain-containing protein [Dichotomocladium elegans]|nr:C2 domain-containing protein [Dichotomocladium elegans]